MMASKIIKVLPLDISRQALFSKELGISKVLAQLLVNRGVNTLEEAHSFLNISLDKLSDPFSFSHMRTAVSKIRSCASSGKRVMIFGDYDVDGITSVALLKDTLHRIGINADHYLPHRIKEGYGLNKNIASIAREKKIDLLITADCGTNSYQQLKELKRANIDVVVTDHHEPVDSIVEEQVTIINPKLQGSGYAYRDLAGVGVAYKLCQALTADKLEEDLDIVALGTVADVVPLTGENRIIVKLGLPQINATKKAGLTALIENSGIKNKKITATSVSFILGPRINASGRMDTADRALELLLSRDKTAAGELAKSLNRCNKDRQKVESRIIEEALCVIEREINFKEHKVIVVSSQGWHQGVLGIVAAKLADRFYRPTIIISENDNLCKGSGRSIKNFHLFDALKECREFLGNFGGHNHAVGLNIPRDNIADFKNKINDVAVKKLSPDDLIPSIEVDMELSFSDINDKTAAELDNLEPFGRGNSEPLFLTRRLRLKARPQILGRDTIKFWVTDGNLTFRAIGFGRAGLMDSLVNADTFSLVYTLRLDTWQGQTNILLEIKDILF